MFEALFDGLEPYKEIVAWLGAISVLMLVGSAVAVPLIVARLPHDYFLGHAEPETLPLGTHPALRVTLLVLKNVLGIAIFLAGMAMLVLPGQGLLTMFIGLLLMDFPGKRRLELRLVRIRGVYRAVNWIRRRTRRKPLALPPAHERREP